MDSFRGFSPLIAALALVLSTPAAAEVTYPELDEDTSDLYVAGGATLSEPQDFDGLDEEWGATAIFGARMSRYASAEISGNYYGEFGDAPFELTGWSIQPTIKLHFPLLKGHLDPFVGFGLGYIGVDSDLGGTAHGAAVHALGGVNVWIHQHVGVRADATYTEAFDGDDLIERADVLSGRFSLVVKF